MVWRTSWRWLKQTRRLEQLPDQEGVGVGRWGACGVLVAHARVSLSCGDARLVAGHEEVGGAGHSEALDHLVPGNIDPQSRMMRRYQILKQTYADQKNADAIIHDLGLSRRQYFYDLREGIEALTHWLVTQYRQ